MFDIVFVFFLFLVGVTCLVYYLPPVRSQNIKCRHQYYNSQYAYHKSRHHQYSNSAINGDGGDLMMTKTVNSGNHSSNLCNNCDENIENVYTFNVIEIDKPSSSSPYSYSSPLSSSSMQSGAATSSPPKCCFVKANLGDLKECTGPVDNV